MILATSHSFLLFESPSLDTSFLSGDQEEEVGGNERVRLVCKYCHHTITSPSAKICVAKKHEHHFFNPQGILFQIGCFRSAPGCTQDPCRSTEFSWFPGYAWRIAYCQNCHCHMGWHYLDSSTDFYGLILENLKEQTKSQE